MNFDLTADPAAAALPRFILPGKEILEKIFPRNTNKRIYKGRIMGSKTSFNKNIVARENFSSITTLLPKMAIFRQTNGIVMYNMGEYYPNKK